MCVERVAQKCVTNKMSVDCRAADISAGTSWPSPSWSRAGGGAEIMPHIVTCNWAGNLRGGGVQSASNSRNPDVGSLNNDGRGRGNTAIMT